MLIILKIKILIGKNEKIITLWTTDKASEDSQCPALNDPHSPSGTPKLANLISDITLPP